MTAAKRRRNALVKNSRGNHTHKQWLELCASYNNECAHCGDDYRKRGYYWLTKDHIRPLLLSGTNNIDNIQPLCHSCNSRKSSRFTKQIGIPECWFIALKEFKVGMRPFIPKVVKERI
jgi:5-methylcytosine-specific restriction endonuclease McrA